MSSETPLPSPQQNVKPKDYYTKFTVCQSALPLMIILTQYPGSEDVHGIHRVCLHISLHEETQYVLVSPCEDASKASLACMDQNGYNRDKCMAYFQAYRDCKRAWVRIVVACCSWRLLSPHTIPYHPLDRRKTGRPSARTSNPDMRIRGIRSLAFRRPCLRQ